VGPNHKSKGPKGRPAGPTPWLVGHTLSRFRPRLGGYAPKAVYKSIQCLKVSADHEEWSAGHVDGCPAVHHLQIDSIKSVEAPLDLYIRILTLEFRTHHLERFQFSSRSTGEALSGVESQVESSLELQK
jgi:hypothetical protein